MNEISKGQAVCSFKLHRSDYTPERWSFLQDNLIIWSGAGVIDIDYIPTDMVTFYQITTPVCIYEFLQHLINA